MSTMNRMANIRNPYQTEAKRVLCVCSAGLLRSPTVANVLHNTYGYNTRAAGVTEEYALIQVDKVLCAWADEIVCVEMRVAMAVRDKMDSLGFERSEVDSKITQLNIPDQFSWNDPELVAIIKEQYAKETEQ